MNVATTTKRRTSRIYSTHRRKTARILSRIFAAGQQAELQVRARLPAPLSFPPSMLERMYVLDGRIPRRARSLEEHMEQFMAFSESDGTRVWRVAETEIPGGSVSTVFLGHDHNFWPDGPPILFESMVFGEHSEEQHRYSTWEQAEAGHAILVAKYRGGRG